MALRTYTAEIDGLNQWIVAAPNQKAALEAFGVQQNLFAQGLADLTRDEALVEVANAQPGVPLKRPKTGGQFTAAGGGSDWSDALKATVKGPAARKPPSRARLDRARAALEAAREEGERTLAKLEAAVASARDRLAAGQGCVEAAVAKAEAAVEAAEEAYRKAGG
ncbi:hypothetical protein [Caulobacter sp. NIBR1757]|uniref:hypothetical protein n=1 Tax=Caulobacter sp. NIBR1757 TaxID=3016000 RepID=UPI0022F11E91|nr:hypothetical protein [Caulobacter sp. NIBR1757]WGM39047.1 hypothetical protein AMEJIAPC_01958 [Caulobacter sp. NIBR1757]